jgi:hypothetical protein
MITGPGVEYSTLLDRSRTCRAVDYLPSQTDSASLIRLVVQLVLMTFCVMFDHSFYLIYKIINHILNFLSDKLNHEIY